MPAKAITDLTAAGTIAGTELMEISQLSTAVLISAATISAAAADNSFNDSGDGFITAGFGVGDRVNVTGFTGDVANNLLVGVITALTAGKMTIGGTDGDVIVDDAAGETVVIAKWTSRSARIGVVRDVKIVEIQVTDPEGDALATGDGQARFVVPSAFNGMNLVSAHAAVAGAVSTSGLPTVQIANQTDGVDMLSTKITIDENETTSYTAAAPAVIDTTKDDVVTGDILRVDVDVAGTGAKGLFVILGFQFPS